jgi:hypothetical protein
MTQQAPWRLVGAQHAMLAAYPIEGFDGGRSEDYLANPPNLTECMNSR